MAVLLQKRDAEMTEEMQFHIESKARELVSSGMNEADARLKRGDGLAACSNRRKPATKFEPAGSSKT